MARRKQKKIFRIGLLQRLEFLFFGKITLPKPKRKAKKRISVDASKGRKRIPTPQEE